MAQRTVGSKSIPLFDANQNAPPHETPFKGYLWANRIQKIIQVLLGLTQPKLGNVVIE